MQCLCCGKVVVTRDTFALHTSCMRNHAEHAKGVRASKCREYRDRIRDPYPKMPEDWDDTSASFDALKDPDSYWHEAKRVKLAGFVRAGILGVSCPRCYKQLQSADQRQPQGEIWCACGMENERDPERHSTPAILRAIGMDPNVRKVTYAHTEVAL